MSNLPKFCIVLREMRIRSKLTQQELADLAGLGVRTIRDLERGQVIRPRKETVRLLASAFRLSGERKNDFMTAAASKLIDSNDIVNELQAEADRNDDDIQALAKLLASERRRLATLMQERESSRSEIIFVAARSIDAPKGWTVLWVPATASA